jgi:hypothetical protein
MVVEILVGVRKMVKFAVFRLIHSVCHEIAILISLVLLACANDLAF